MNITATFDALVPTPGLRTFTENGITFSSPSGNFSVISGAIAADAFGWGGYAYQGKAIAVSNQGWVSISAGSPLDSVSFRYGFNWSHLAIEQGLLDTHFGWQAWSGDQMVASGSQTWGRDNRTHGGMTLSVNPELEFDALLVRSTATAYQGIYTGGTGAGGWWYEQGQVIGYGNLNRIALDNVTVTPAMATERIIAASIPSVPDGGLSAVLFAVALAVVATLRHWQFRGGL